MSDTTSATNTETIPDSKVEEPSPKKVKISQDAEELVKVMLGSSSKFRAALVANAMPEGCQLTKERLSPDIDEKAIRRDDPSEMVLAISEAKTEKLISDLAKRSKLAKEKGDVIEEPDVLICCDQVICFKDQVREKPVDAAQAKAHLQSYGEQDVPAKCVSGVVVTNLKTGKRVSEVDIAVQNFKPVPDNIAEALIAKGDILYCAGSFVVEDELLAPYLGPRIGEIESVQGMPIAMTKRMIETVLETEHERI